MRKVCIGASIVLALSLAGPAMAQQNLVFSGTVADTCTLGVDTDGTLELAADNLSMASDLATGGLSAVLTIISLGSNEITVGAPSLTEQPAAYDDSGQTLQVKYSGLAGLTPINQPYTTAETSFNVGIVPLVELTVDNKINNPNGFAQGDYETTTVVTCS